MAGPWGYCTPLILLQHTQEVDQVIPHMDDVPLLQLRLGANPVNNDDDLESFNIRNVAPFLPDLQHTLYPVSCI